MPSACPDLPRFQSPQRHNLVLLLVSPRGRHLLQVLAVLERPQSRYPLPLPPHARTDADSGIAAQRQAGDAKPGHRDGQPRRRLRSDVGAGHARQGRGLLPGASRHRARRPASLVRLSLAPLRLRLLFRAVSSTWCWCHAAIRHESHLRRSGLVRDDAGRLPDCGRVPAIGPHRSPPGRTAKRTAKGSNNPLAKTPPETAFVTLVRQWFDPTSIMMPRLPRWQGISSSSSVSCCWTDSTTRTPSPGWRLRRCT